MTDNKRIVIIGGVAGGASAAARVRRLSENAEIVMFERGEYISFANCGLPYHIGGVITNRSRLLVQTPQSMHRRYRIDVRIKTEVIRIDRTKKKVVARSLDTGKEYTESYDALILSPGAVPVRPDIPGAHLPRVFCLRSMSDMDEIKRIVDSGKSSRAVVVGAGYIGLEITEALRERNVAVTIVELAPQVMVLIDPEMSAPLKQLLVHHGVDLRLNTSVAGITEKGNSLDVKLSTGDSVDCNLLIFSIGVRPETKLARDAGIEIGETGGIAVDERMRTSDPSIYAVGDAVQVKDFGSGFDTLVPLAGPANRQGRIAADVIFGRDSVYRRTQGTGICKVFELTVGMTGLSEKALKKRGIPCEKIYIYPADHASYYPDAGQIGLKLLFDPAGGKILGAQAVGAKGVDKRIDVLAVALRAGMTVFDLEHLELCYAPPYGSAKDPVNYAGFVASNVVRGDVKIWHYEDLAISGSDPCLLDVRSPAEVRAGTIPGARAIPVDELRDRLSELPKDRELFVFCLVGLRGYIACRILAQHGYTCRNLSGGYTIYRAFVDSLPVSGGMLGEICDDAGEHGPICENGLDSE